MQRDMVEKRIERAKEREKSVLYKAATSTSPVLNSGSGFGGSAPATGGGGGVSISAPSTYPDAALELTEPTAKGTTLDAAEVAAIEAELSPEQLQLFAEENDSMVRYYEDTLNKVQYVSPHSFSQCKSDTTLTKALFPLRNRNAEKSLLEISSLQQTLVTHLSTQEEYVGMMVADASNTETNIGRGNKELKRASEKRSAAQAVFWGTVGLCTWLVVWDLVF